MQTGPPPGDAAGVFCKGLTVMCSGFVVKSTLPHPLNIKADRLAVPVPLKFTRTVVSAKALPAKTEMTDPE